LTKNIISLAALLIIRFIFNSVGAYFLDHPVYVFRRLYATRAMQLCKVVTFLSNKCGQKFLRRGLSFGALHARQRIKRAMQKPACHYSNALLIYGVL